MPENRDTLFEIGVMLDACYAAIDGIIECDHVRRSYYQAALYPIAMEWQILSADAGLMPDPITGGCGGSGGCRTGGLTTIAILGVGVVGAAALWAHAMASFPTRARAKIREVASEILARETLSESGYAAARSVAGFSILGALGGAAKFVVGVTVLIFTINGAQWAYDSAKRKFEETQK